MLQKSSYLCKLIDVYDKHVKLKLLIRQGTHYIAGNNIKQMKNLQMLMIKNLIFQ